MVKTLAQSCCVSRPQIACYHIELKSPINSSLCLLQHCHACQLVTNTRNFKIHILSAVRRPTALEGEKNTSIPFSRYIVAKNKGLPWSAILQERLVKGVVRLENDIR